MHLPSGNITFEVVKCVYDKLLDMKGNSKNCPVVLVGNKNDLTNDREVTTAEGKKQAEEWKVAFLETSAKEHQSVTEVFNRIIQAIERAEGNEPEKGGCIVS